jgi:hypothetical protein
MLQIEMRGLDTRGLEGRMLPGFTVAHETITGIFLARGVLRSRAFPISPSRQE